MAKKLVRKLYRSESDRVVAGVAAGLAEYFELDVKLVRLATLVLILFGFGLPAYIVGWIMIPSESRVNKDPDENIRANAKEMKTAVKSFARDAESRREWGGVILIVLGALFLLQNFNFLPWNMWGSIWRLWPVIFVLIGIRILSDHDR